MKKIAVFIFLIFTFSTYSQSKGNYLINKNVQITRIEFEKSPGNVYSKTKEKKLTKLEFYLTEKRRSTEKECFLIRHYDYDYNIDFKDYKKLREKQKENVDIEYFYELVDKLNNMNTDELNENLNVMDGITYNIKFSGENYKISFYDNWEDETKSDFYNLFKSVWNKYNQ